LHTYKVEEVLGLRLNIKQSPHSCNKAYLIIPEYRSILTYEYNSARKKNRAFGLRGFAAWFYYLGFHVIAAERRTSLPLAGIDYPGSDVFPYYAVLVFQYSPLPFIQSDLFGRKKFWHINNGIMDFFHEKRYYKRIALQ